MEIVKPGAQQLMGDKGSYLPNCQTNLVIDLYAPSLLFWNFTNTTAYHFNQCEPSSTSASIVTQPNLIKQATMSKARMLLAS